MEIVGVITQQLLLDDPGSRHFGTTHHRRAWHDDGMGLRRLVAREPRRHEPRRRDDTRRLEDETDPLVAVLVTMLVAILVTLLVTILEDSKTKQIPWNRWFFIAGGVVLFGVWSIWLTQGGLVPGHRAHVQHGSHAHSTGITHRPRFSHVLRTCEMA